MRVSRVLHDPVPECNQCPRGRRSVEHNGTSNLLNVDKNELHLG
jgi:hypothetical protein